MTFCCLQGDTDDLLFAWKSSHEQISTDGDVGELLASDEFAGLQYNQCRHYDPTPGRYCSEDPIGYDGGDESLQKVHRQVILVPGE